VSGSSTIRRKKINLNNQNQYEDYGSPVAVGDGDGEGGFGLLSSLIYGIFGRVVLVVGRFCVVGMEGRGCSVTVIGERDHRWW